MRRLGRVLALLVVLVGLAGGGVVCQRVAARGRFAVAYSTYGAGPDGARGLYLLAEAEGLRPARWAQDLAGLPEDAMVVALGGCDAHMSREVSRYERQELERWVDAGGVLLIAGASDYAWEELGVTMDPPAGCFPLSSLARDLARAERGEPIVEDEPEDEGPAEPRDEGSSPFFPTEDPAETFEEVTEGEGPPPAVWAAPVGGALAGLGSVPLRRPATIVVEEGADAETILQTPAGPAGVIVRRGEGAVVALASASPFQNRDLATGDGGVILARIVAALESTGPVIFDEYHLGVGERRSLVSYLQTVGGGPAILQALLIVALVLWRFGARFGRPRAEAPVPPGGTASYVAAVGALYDKSADVGAARAILARHALRQVAAFHHVEGTDASHLARTLESRGRTEERALVERLGVIAASAAGDSRSLVADAREIDSLVERATRGQATSEARSRREREGATLPPRTKLAKG